MKFTKQEIELIIKILESYLKEKTEEIKKVDELLNRLWKEV